LIGGLFNGSGALSVLVGHMEGHATVKIPLQRCQKDSYVFLWGLYITCSEPGKYSS